MTAGGDELQREHDAKRDDDDVVKVAKDGNEIRDEVYRAEGIGHDARPDDFGVPGSTGVTDSEIKRVRVALNAARPLAGAGECAGRGGIAGWAGGWPGHAAASRQ